jgi:hypothetical protein
MDPYIAAIKATTMSQMILQYRWVWPACESLHFIGLALVVGIAGFLDLRLLGMFPQVPVHAIHRMVKWAIVGFVINLITGLIFLIGAPDQYAKNPVWWFKVVFLIVAGLNALFFETTQGKRVMALGAGEPVPVTFRLVGAVSLFSWLMVLYWGRMLPFIGTAF